MPLNSLARTSNDISPEEAAALLSAAPEPAEEPDDFTPEQVAEVIKGGVPGRPNVLQEAVAGGLEGTANLAGLGRLGAEAVGLNTPIFEDLEAGFRGASQQVLPQEQRGRGGFAGELANTLGSMGSMTGVPGGNVGRSLAYAAQGGMPLYYDVLKATNDKEKATKALIFGGLTGQLEKLGVEGMLTKGLLKRLSTGKMGAAVKNLFMHVAVSGASEPTTEAAQQGLDDLAYETLTGEDLDNWARIRAVLPTAALVGTGAAIVDGVIGRVARRKSVEAGDVDTEPTEPSPAPDASQEFQGAAPAATAPTEAIAAPEAAPTEGAGFLGPEGPAPTLEERTAEAQEELPPEIEREFPITLERDEAKLTLKKAKKAKKQPEPAAPVVQPPNAGPTPEATPEEPTKATGIKNATVQKELEEMGMDLPEKGEVKGFVELHAKAKQAFEESKGKAGRELVDDLETSPRNVSDDEDALLAFEANRLSNERKAAEKDYLENPTEANQKRVDEARAAYKRAADVFDKAGTATGRALNARKMMLKEDYSLAAIERRVQVAKGDDALSKEELAKVKALSEEVAAAHKALEGRVTKLEQKKADAAIRKVEKEVGRVERKAKRKLSIEQAKKDLAAAEADLSRSLYGKTGSVLGVLNAQTLKSTARVAAAWVKIGGKTFAQFVDDMVAKFGEPIRPYLRPAWDDATREYEKGLTTKVSEKIKKGKKLEEVGADISEIASDYFERGVTDTEQLVDSVHGAMKGVEPSITKREVRDAIAGEGKFKKPTKVETARSLRDAKREMRLISKLEDLQNRVARPKSAKAGRMASLLETRLKKQIKELQAQLRINAKAPVDQTKSRQQARKTRLKNRIKELEERLRVGDFAKKEKKPIKRDAEEISLQTDVKRVEGKVKAEEEKLRLAQRDNYEKARDLFYEIVDLDRSIFSGFDLSAVRRQGGFLTSGHPILATKNFKDMLRAAKNPKTFQELDTLIRKEQSEIIGGDKLELTSADGIGPQEEGIRSKLSDKIPGIKGSNRAFVTYLNLFRIQVHKAMVESLPHTPTEAEAHAIADFVNIATGRATGKGAFIADRLEGIRFFYAPKYMISRFQIYGRPVTMMFDKRLTWAGRRAIGKQYTRYIAGQAAYYTALGFYAALLGEITGEELETEVNPLSSDWGKIQLGKVRIDPLSGLAQTGVLLARMAAKKTLTLKGKEKELKGGKSDFDQSRLDVLFRYIRSKAGPMASRVWDALDEETYLGKPITPTKALLRLPLPGGLGDIWKAGEALGVPAGAMLAPIAILGDSVQTHEDD